LRNDFLDYTTCEQDPNQYHLIRFENDPAWESDISYPHHERLLQYAVGLFTKSEASSVDQQGLYRFSVSLKCYDSAGDEIVLGPSPSSVHNSIKSFCYSKDSYTIIAHVEHRVQPPGIAVNDESPA